VQISPVGGSGRTLSCVSASILGWWKQIDRMHFHALISVLIFLSKYRVIHAE
jgi:hypothetical protein